MFRTVGFEEEQIPRYMRGQEQLETEGDDATSEPLLSPVQYRYQLAFGTRSTIGRGRFDGRQ